MKQLIEFIPLLIFFVLFKTNGIFVATGALIVTTAIQLIVTWVIYKKIEKMQLITFAMVAIFGGLTLFLHDENFIKWKVTIIYGLFALALLISQLMHKPLIKSMLGKEMTLPENVWLRINLAWTVFFVVCAIVNIYIAFNFPLDVWVDFKVFGLLALTLLFTFATGGYIYRHLPKSPDDK
ncbi:septation protein A [Photobacterium toruni]|uniref:Inner membrane-spanning protein YciB n=1 Tax=Photobacterium toruni TaxID=1935446 RepID=A0A1T4L895_9GAMM|nr:septation protein A [Photobacterium toruni]MEC6831747.1 septation protein A [Photobacterium toruni]SJZ50959.1 putative intracellular septation protein A [Photobacterium toruni]